MRSKYKYKLLGMYDSEPEELLYSDDSQPVDFAHLCPVEEEKTVKVKRLPGGFNWMKAPDKDAKKPKKAPAKPKGRRERGEEGEREGRSRSRSRSREQRRKQESLTVHEENESGREYIEISDDEGDAALLERYYKIGGEYYSKESVQFLNWRERRRLERLFAREQRKYLEGKPKDQLSFTLFNTIDLYFK